MRNLVSFFFITWFAFSFFRCCSRLVFDPTSKTCIKPSECPCHHAGRSYGENNLITQDCNTWFVANSKIVYRNMVPARESKSWWFLRLTRSRETLWIHARCDFYLQYLSFGQMGMHQKSMPGDMLQLGRVTLQDIRWYQIILAYFYLFAFDISSFERKVCLQCAYLLFNT